MERLTDRLPKREKAHLHEDFLENEKSYWGVRERLLPRYKGKWIAVRAGEVMAEADDVFDILDRAEELGGHLYIARVGFEDRHFVIRRIFPYDTDYQPFPLPRVTARFIGQAFIPLLCECHQGHHRAERNGFGLRGSCRDRRIFLSLAHPAG